MMIRVIRLLLCDIKIILAKKKLKHYTKAEAYASDKSLYNLRPKQSKSYVSFFAYVGIRFPEVDF